MLFLHFNLFFSIYKFYILNAYFVSETLIKTIALHAQVYWIKLNEVIEPLLHENEKMLQYKILKNTK
jgi:hypothetical protein